MNRLIAGLAGVVLIFTFSWNLQAQLTGDLSAIEATTPLTADEVPTVGTFYSAQNPNWPPLPGNLRNLPAWDLGEGRYLLDDLDVDYESIGSIHSAGRMHAMDDSGGGSPSPFNSYPTNGLWLEITNVSGGLAYLNLHNATDYVYEVWSKTDLAAPSWDIAGEVFPTDTNCMPFTMPQTSLTNLFFWARDWTGITSNGNETPEWWLWKYFGTVNLSDTNLDSLGNNTLLHDYQYGHDPNLIEFYFDLPIGPVTSNTVNTTIEVAEGTPAYTAMLVNDTNTADAVWQSYTSNMVVNLNSGNGVYNVLIGLRGLPDDATQTWHSQQLALYSVPLTLTITSPTSSTVSVPMIQVQGFADETLSNLTFDVSNAAGIFTNQTGYLTSQFYDMSLLAFTTNYFQCYDINLTNGVNLITLHATDLAGNTTTTNVTYTLSYAGVTNPPVLSLIWPTNGTVISGSNFTLQAQIDDDTATVTASITDTNGDTNIVQGLVERSGTVWVQNLPLANGTNAVTITATDAAGNMSTTNLNVVQSGVSLTIDPISSDQLNQPTVTVTGTVSDPSDTVTVNGVSAYFYDDDGDWEADGVPVSPTGTASLNAEVTDGSGNPLASQNVYQAQPATVVVASYSATEYLSGVAHNENSAYWPFESDTAEGWVFGKGGYWQDWGWGESFDGDEVFGPYSGSFSGSLGADDAPSSWETVFRSGAISASENLQESIKTHVMILPSGQQQIGQSMLYLVQAQVMDEDSGLQLVAGVVRFINQLTGTTTEDVTNSDGSVWSQGLVSAAASAQVEVTPQANGFTNINFSQMQISKLVYISVDTANEPLIFDANAVQTTFQSELFSNVFYSLPAGEGVQIKVNVEATLSKKLGWDSSAKQTYVDRVVWGEAIAGGPAYSDRNGNTTIDPIASRNHNAGSDPGTQFWVNVLAHEVIWLSACRFHDHDFSPPAGEISSGLWPPLTAEFTVWPANQAYIISAFGF
jgi:hypothetical protein